MKIEDDLEDYLSCKIHFSKENFSAWLGQPHLLATLERKFGSLVTSVCMHKTPGTPGHGVTHPTSDEEKINKEKQALYRSGLGMLLYLVKHSRHDIANAVQECTKVLDGANEKAYQEMLHIIKYVLNTKNLELKIKPNFRYNEPWELVCYSASDYASDTDSRQSVSRFTLYVCQVPIS